MGGELQLAFNGLVSGSIFVLLAIGITIIYGLSGVINFAQGQTLALGAYVTLSLVERDISFWLAMAAAVAVTAGLGFALSRGLFRYTIERPIAGFILSLGLIAVMEALIVHVWGSETESIPPPISGTVEIAGVVMARQRLVTLGIALLAVGVLTLWLRVTHSGREIRAAAEDRETAAILGVNTARTLDLTFVVGSALAGIAGALFLSQAAINPFVGVDLVFTAFVVTLIGGLGSVAGAATVGLSLGVIQSFMAGHVDAGWSNAYPFIIMAIVLLIWPSGIFRGAAGAELR